jgi:hypothetical protein
MVHVPPTDPITGPARRLLRGRAWAQVAVCLWFLVGLGVAELRAQGTSNLRERWVQMKADTIVLDTLSIVPGSLVVLVDSVPLPLTDFSLDPYTARLTLRSEADSVLVRYRVMPLLFSGVRLHKDTLRTRAPDGSVRIDPFRYEPPRQSTDLMGLQGLNRSGSISRGVLFGNNQDLSVNSTLNLELNGRLNDKIQVLASITDNNIPIQAGGNTLELQDFDQVFIKLFEEDTRRTGNLWELVAGDFVLQRPTSHFLTYLKKTKGLDYNTHLWTSDRSRSDLGASIAISKGKFARFQVQGIEGVQGPYRLRGNDGEAFIIVLSGTERVYIDGQLLTRGQENDYVIDYNTAEVTFTARRLITKDRRITVEFQYSDKNYARSLVRLDNTTVMGRSTVRFHLFSEQDHKNQSLQQQLSEEERDVLAAAGDDPLDAVVSGVDSTGFADDQVLYLLTDSLGYDSVFVNSTDPGVAVYRLTFTQVGMGNGDYVQQEFTPNGRVFRWVAPDTVNGLIIKRGDHAPVRVLIAPRSQQVITLGVDHQFTDRTSMTLEGAFSHDDRNTFSSLDRADDDGLGLLTRLKHEIPLGARDTTLRLLVMGEAEGITREFRPVERYRAVEFERNWNARDIPLDGDQLLASTGVGIKGRKLGSLTYAIGTFQARDRYAGWKQDLNSDLHIGRTDLVGTASWLSATTPRTTDFLRHKGTLRHRLKPLTLGLNSEHERNLFKTDTTSGLNAGSYQFHEWEAFAQSPDTLRNKWRIAGGQRTDQAVRNGALATSTVANTGSFGVDLARDPRKRLSATFTYRSLEIRDSTLSSNRPESTYLARIDHDATLWKGVAIIDLFYEFSSGLEQQRSYVYIEVPAGQGLYIWIDYNGDGIKDLNEFELANFGYEANYLRVFVPSDTYVRTYRNQLSASLDLRPGVRWSDTEGLRHFLGKFSDMASFRVDRKTGADDVLNGMDPFLSERSDTSLLAYNGSARNTIYYDRTSRTWSIDHTWQNDRSRTLLLNGYESRSRLNNALHVRWNITRHWTFEVETERGRVANASDLLSGRTYTIDQDGLRPRLTWQPGTTFRTLVTYKLTEKRNAAEFGGEQATLHDLGLEMRYNTPGKGSMLVNANLVEIRYDGEVNSPLGNEMLGGLKPGTNATWSISLQRNLSNNLQVDITYNGRRSEGVPVVHVGGAQVRAYF